MQFKKALLKLLSVEATIVNQIHMKLLHLWNYLLQICQQWILTMKY